MSEGSGLTSRQVAGLLWRKGHNVGVVSSDPIGLTRFTRAVRRWHRIEPFGTDPLAWLDTVCDLYRSNDYDLLFPTQEQVAVLAAFPQRLAEAGVATAVPTFATLLAVQDKIAARATLQRLGLTQPRSEIVTTIEELAAWDRFPVYVKTPIGTATTGVHRVDDHNELQALLTELTPDAFADGGLLAQDVADGPLVMVQSVFGNGRLIAFHANLRIAEGVRGGASHKRSINSPDTRQALEKLGAGLDWNGALSADVILTNAGPSIIDINPRMVEPMNAHQSGVDLVGALIDVAANTEPVAVPDGQSDINTHQLLIAIAGAAQDRRGRRGIAHELWTSATHRNDYHNSIEELTPLHPTPGHFDWRAALPVAAVAASTLVAPTTWQHFAPAASAPTPSLQPRGAPSANSTAHCPDPAACEEDAIHRRCGRDAGLARG